MTRSTAGGGSAASPCSLIVLAVIIAMMMRAVGMRFRMPDIVEDGRWALWLIPSLLIWSIWCISYSLGKAGIISWIAYKGVNAVSIAIAGFAAIMGSAHI